MFRVFIPNLNRWIENIPVNEALVYKQEGYCVERMNPVDAVLKAYAG